MKTIWRLLVSWFTQGYNLDRIRNEVEEFNRELMLSIYDSDAHGKPSRISEIYDHHTRLIADRGLVLFVRGLRDRERNPWERKRLAYLYAALLNSYLGQTVKELQDRICDLQVVLKVVVDDDTLSFREVEDRIFNQRDRTLRRKLYHARGRQIVERLNPLLQRELERVHRTVEGFGYTTFASYYAEVRQIDFDRLETECRNILEQTEGIYREMLAGMAEENLGLTIDEVRVYDRARLYRGEEYDRYFPRKEMVPRIKATLSGMGFDLDSQRNIDIDDEVRPEKEPRAGTYSIIVPEDIRVLVKPAGGVNDYEALLHELGHAEHYVNTTVEEYEFRALGDVSLSETYAFLFASVLFHPVFLRKHTAMTSKEIGNFMRLGLFGRLSGIRYYCGMFPFERRLHRGASNPVEVYREWIERARLTRETEEECRMSYLLYGDEGFYSVNYLKGWILEAQLRAKLEEQFGSNWFESPDAGISLCSLWATGCEFSAEEMAQRIGYTGLDADFLIREVQESYAALRSIKPGTRYRSI